MKNIYLGLPIFLLAVFLFTGTVMAFKGGNCMIAPGFSDNNSTEMQELKEDLIQAIENNDFDAWEELMVSQLTRERFEKIVEQHNSTNKSLQIRQEFQQAWKDEDYEKIKELREQMQENMPKGLQKKFNEEECKGEGNCQFKSQGKGNMWKRFAFWK